MAKQKIDLKSNQPADTVISADGVQSADSDDRAQVIFDDRNRLFYEQLKVACEQNDITMAVAIVYDPKIPKQPLVFARGHVFDVAEALTDMLRDLKSQIAQRLAT